MKRGENGREEKMKSLIFILTKNANLKGSLRLGTKSSLRRQGRNL